jgi:hypothetical protein
MFSFCCCCGPEVVENDDLPVSQKQEDCSIRQQDGKSPLLSEVPHPMPPSNDCCTGVSSLDVSVPECVSIRLVDCPEATSIFHKDLRKKPGDAQRDGGGGGGGGGGSGGSAGIYVHNCPRIVRLPDLSGAAFGALESIRLSHLTLERFEAALPSALRTLSVRYCVMRAFEPAGRLPRTLAVLDLSFNSLQEIPRAIKTAFSASDSARATRGGAEEGRGVVVNPFVVKLDNNDFWYSAYTGLRASAVTPEVVAELTWAHRLGIIGTSRVVEAAHILVASRDARGAAASASLRALLRTQLRTRDEGDRNTTFANPQNVHLESVDASARQSVAWLLQATAACGPAPEARALVTRLRVRHAFGPAAVAQVEAGCRSEAVHGDLGLTYRELLWRVLCVAEGRHARPGAAPEASEAPAWDACDFCGIAAVLEEEVKAGGETCFTGRMVRLLNALVGFVPEVTVGISAAEELADAVLVARRRIAAKHDGDPEAYLAEAIPAVWQILENACVPVERHAAWLEYV